MAAVARRLPGFSTLSAYRVSMALRSNTGSLGSFSLHAATARRLLSNRMKRRFIDAVNTLLLDVLKLIIAEFVDVLQQVAGAYTVRFIHAERICTEIAAQRCKLAV